MGKVKELCVNCGEHPQESMELCGQCLAVFDAEYTLYLAGELNPDDERNERLQAGVRD